MEGALAELRYSPASRTKTPGTIIDKLRRETTRLTSIQDIAGSRIVPEVTLTGQDGVVDEVRARLGGIVHDRRESPRHGYRAVHIVVRSHGRRVEIQIRTPLQHLWAEVMERVGDRYGRGIRYGSLPAEPERRDVVEGLIGMADEIAEHEKLRDGVLRLEQEIAQSALDDDALSQEDVALLKRHAELKDDLDADEISFRRALRIILDALEEGEPP